MWALLTANVPMTILLLVGVGLIVFEMYIPGFGLPGILGIATVTLGFVLLRPTFSQGLLLLAVLASVLCVALVICLVTASKGRFEKSKLALKDVAIDPEAAKLNSYNDYIGKTGITRTALCPAGLAEFDGARLNVVSDGEFIPEGMPVVVRSVSGNRVVVVPEHNKGGQNL